MKIIVLAACLLFCAGSVRAEAVPVDKPGEIVSVIRQKSIHILQTAAQNENAFIRSAAYRAAGESGDLEMSPLLQQGLKDVYPTARLFALQTLRKIAPADVRTLAPQLAGDTDIWIRGQAVEILGESGGGPDRAALKKLLKDPDTTVRMAAGAALANLGDKGHLSLLYDSLAGGDPNLRNQAIGYLGKVVDSEARKRLIRMLHDPDSQTLFYALKSISQQEVPPQAASRLRELVHHTDPSVRKEAIAALEKLNHPGDEALLQGMCGDGDAMVRLAAAVALVRLKSRFCRDEFSRSLKADDFGVRSAAARILGQLDIPGREALLGQAMRDENSRVRTAAVRAVGMMGGPKALPLLISALDDSQEAVRAYAAGALLKLMK